jgi:hypothetical protein
VLYQGVAVEASFPSFLFSQEIGKVHVIVLRAFLSSVSGSTAYRACHMRIIADSLASTGIDTLGTDPEAAAWAAAVNTFADGDLPLLGSVVKRLLEVGRDEPQDRLERDLV